MTDRAGTSIDYCPQCRGVWLEKGKLDLIIEKSSGNISNDQTGRSDKRNDRDDDDEGGVGGFFGKFFD
jgi:Zn-finger nucleic acid-binding protein